MFALGRESYTAGAGEPRASPGRTPGASWEMEGTSQALTGEGRGVFGVGDGARQKVSPPRLWEPQEEVPAGPGLRKAV